MERRDLFKYIGLASVAFVVDQCMPTYTGGKTPSNLNAQGNACPEGMTFVRTDKKSTRADRR